MISPFNYTTPTTYLLYILLCLFFLKVMDLGVGGFLISYGIKVLVDTVFYIFLIKKYNEIKLFWPSFKTVISECRDKLSFVLFTLFGLFGSIFSARVNYYFAAYSGNPRDIASWQYFFTIYFMLIIVILGYNSVFRTFGGY